MRVRMRIRKHSLELDPERVIQKHPKLLKFVRARIESASAERGLRAETRGPTGMRNEERECGMAQALNCDSAGVYF